MDSWPCTAHHENNSCRTPEIAGKVTDCQRGHVRSYGWVTSGNLGLSLSCITTALRSGHVCKVGLWIDVVCYVAEQFLMLGMSGFHHVTH